MRFQVKKFVVVKIGVHPSTLDLNKCNIPFDDAVYERKIFSLNMVSRGYPAHTIWVQKRVPMGSQSAQEFHLTC